MSAEDTSNWPSGRILLVDDAPATIHLLMDLLRRRGYAVHPATESPLALEFIRATPPDLILLDVHMPGMDGYELCARLRDEPQAREIPVIFLSSLDRTFNKVKAFRSGAVDYVTKPFDSEEVLARIETHLSLRRVVKELRQTEAVLQGSEHRFRTFVDHAIDSFLLHDERGNVLDVNRQACESLGYRREELIGMFPSRFDVDVTPARAEELLQRLDAGEKLAFDSRYRRKDGSMFPVEVRISPFWDNGRRFAVALCRDVTERKRAEEALRESEHRWRSLTETLPQLVWTCTPDGSRDYLSTQWRGFAGVPEAELLGWRWLELVHPDDRDRTLIAWNAAVAGQGDYGLEHRLRRSDGAYRWFQSRGVPIRDSAGAIVKWSGTSTDISERKQVEEELRLAKDRLDMAIRCANIGIWEADIPDGLVEHVRTNYINLWEMLGYDGLKVPTTPEESQEFVHPNDRERLWRLVESNWAGDTSDLRSEHRIRHRDGSYRWVLIRGETLRDAQGRPRRQAGVLVDIHDLKCAEEQLRKGEERFRGTFENAAVGIAHKDLAGRFLRVNQKFCDIIGYTREELLTKTWRDITDPADLATNLEWYARLISGESPSFSVEKRYLRKDQSPVWAEVSVSLQRDEVGSPAYAIAMVQDISERKRLEAELRHASDRLVLALRGSKIGIWEVEIPDGILANSRVEMWNCQEQFGYENPRSTVDYTTSQIPVHPDDRSRVDRAAEACLSGESEAFEIEHRALHLDGSCRWVLSRATTVRDAQGRPIRLSGSVVDITDAKRAELALRESEERFRGTFDNAAIGIAHVDAESRCLRANQKMCEILGYTGTELVGKTVPEVTHPDDLASNLFMFGALMRGELPTFSMEKRFFHRDGSIVATYLTVSLQRDEAGKPAYAIVMVQDITELKRMERELRQAKEAAEAANRAKDEFLANVSHEIRTPMNAILGMTELTLDTPLDQDQRQYLKTVRSAADNLLGMLNDLLDFSRIEAGKLELEAGDFSLRAALTDTLRTLAMRAHMKGLELISHVQPDLPDALVGDASRLRQVLLNLVGNAIKFTERGEVVVRVEPEGEAAADGEVGVRFAVSDTGIGIPPEKQEAIFRAFEQEDTSTTRKYGGTGLGLTIAARLAALMKGAIAVESRPGRGSTFTFTARFGRQEHPPELASARSPVPLEGAHVLVVDDNATNRRILVEWLRGWRLDPVAAGDGLAALDALWGAVAAGRPFDLVLLDARMPDTDGLSLATKIRKRPELSAVRIILLTSGDFPGDPARARELRIDAHLLKPVQPDELLEAIGRVMSRAWDEAPAARETAPAAVPTASPLHILVAEDNDFNALHLEQLLVRRGHRPRLAKNGREALALSESGPFDLMLLDIHMPELDGFQVARAVRERERADGGHLPILALTARSTRIDRERCLAAGMDDYLPKPIRAADLWAAIDRLATARPPAQLGLIDPRVLLAACGEDGVILEKLCGALKAGLPDHVAAVEEALHAGDAPRLRDAAHRLCGMVAAFSTVAGSVASEVEDHGAGGRIELARPLVEQLATMARELIRLAGGLSLETLRRQAHVVDAPLKTN